MGKPARTSVAAFDLALESLLLPPVRGGSHGMERAPACVSLQTQDARAACRPDIVDEATAWRLAGLPRAEIATLATRLWPHAEGLAEDFLKQPDVAAALRESARRGDRRGAWSLACAVLAWEARRRGDLGVLLAAGFEVVQAHRNARRGAGPRRLDVLSELIVEHLRHHPRASGLGMFAHFGSLASGFHEALVDFDPDRKVLTYAAENGKSRDIGERAFCVRVSRLRHFNNALM